LYRDHEQFPSTLTGSKIPTSRFWDYKEKRLGMKTHH